jgi:hypothetical protein
MDRHCPLLCCQLSRTRCDGEVSTRGEKLIDAAHIIFSALIYPYSGVIRGIEAIIRRAAYHQGNELQRAARAGALCVVVRSELWTPNGGQTVKGIEISLASSAKRSSKVDLPGISNLRKLLAPSEKEPPATTEATAEVQHFSR